MSPNESFASEISSLVSNSAAYGVLCLVHLNPTLPVPQPITLFPWVSVIVTIVLLNVVVIYNLHLGSLIFFFFFFDAAIRLIQNNKKVVSFFVPRTMLRTMLQAMPYAYAPAFFFKTGLTLDLPRSFLAVLACLRVRCPLTGSQTLCLIHL